MAEDLKAIIAETNKAFDFTKPVTLDGGKLHDLIFEVEREIYLKIEATGGKILVGKDKIEIMIPDLVSLVEETSILKNTLALPRSGLKGCCFYSSQSLGCFNTNP